MTAYRVLSEPATLRSLMTHRISSSFETMRNHLIRHTLAATLLLGALVSPEAITAQGRASDQGALRVRIGATDVAREEFSIWRGRSTSGGIGFRISATAFYPPRRTKVTISPSVELGPDSLPRLAQFPPMTGSDVRTVAQFGPRILILRRFWTGSESFREHPGVARNWVVDDSVLALYAVPPGTQTGPVRLVSPRQGWRTDYQLTNRGQEETAVQGRLRELLHLVLSAGTDVRHLWYDNDGRLMKVEIPARRLTAVRLLDSAMPGR